MSFKGTFRPPGDKSISHRIALLSLLAGGSCRVENYSSAEDPATTLRVVKALGGEIQRAEDALILMGKEGRINVDGELQCDNSGTTMRLLMGILAGRPGRFLLDGDASLRKRPMERVADPLRRMGAHVACAEGCPPVSIEGARLSGIDYTLPVPSAQLKSAVLLAGVQSEGVTRVHEPVPSRDHTERLLRQCRGNISRTSDGWSVSSSNLAMPEELRIPGDASSAAFFICTAAIIPDSDVTAEGALLNPTRTGFLDVLSRMGAEVTTERLQEHPEPVGEIRAIYSPRLTGCVIASHEIPHLVDEVPILALVATQAHGTTVFHEVGELRVKESDRLEGLVTQLGAMGARIGAKGDDLVIEGPTPLHAPAMLHSFGDHRIAMMLRLAGLLADSEPRIEGEECVSVSYPGFHTVLGSLIQ